MWSSFYLLLFISIIYAHSTPGKTPTLEDSFTQIFKPKSGKITFHIATEYGQNVEGGIGTLMNTLPGYTSKLFAADQDVFIILPGRLVYLAAFPSAVRLKTINVGGDSVDILMHVEASGLRVLIFKFPSARSHEKLRNSLFYVTDNENFYFNKAVLQFLALLEQNNSFYDRKVVVVEHGIGQITSALGPLRIPSESFLFVHALHDLNNRDGKYNSHHLVNYFVDYPAIHGRILDRNYLASEVQSFAELLAADNSDLTLVPSRITAQLLGDKKLTPKFPSASLGDLYQKLYANGKMLGISPSTMFNYKFNPFTNTQLKGLGASYDSWDILTARDKARLFLIEKLGISSDLISKPWAFYVGRVDSIKGIVNLPAIAKEFTSQGGVFIMMTKRELEAAAKSNYGQSNVFFVTNQKEYGIFVRAACDIGVFPSHDEIFGLAQVESLNAGHLLITTNAGGITEYAADGNNVDESEWHKNADSDECKKIITEAEGCINGLLSGQLSMPKSCLDIVSNCFSFNAFLIKSITQNGDILGPVRKAYRFISLMRQPENANTFETFIKSTMANALKFYIESETGFARQFDKIMDEKLMSKKITPAVNLSDIFSGKTGKITFHIASEYGKHVRGGIGSLMNTWPKYTAQFYKDQDVCLILPGRDIYVKDYSKATFLMRMNFHLKTEYVDIYLHQDGEVKVLLFKFPHAFPQHYLTSLYYGLGLENFYFNKSILEFIRRGHDSGIFHGREIAVVEHGIGQVTAVVGSLAKLPGVYVHMLHDYAYRAESYNHNRLPLFFQDQQWKQLFDPTALNNIAYHHPNPAEAQVHSSIELLTCFHSDITLATSKKVAELLGKREIKPTFHPNDHRLTNAYKELYKSNRLAGLSNPVMFNYKLNPFTNTQLRSRDIFFDDDIFIARHKARTFLLLEEKFGITVSDVNMPWGFFVGRFGGDKGSDDLPNLSAAFIEKGGVFFVMTFSPLKDEERSKYHHKVKFILGSEMQEKYGIFIRAACDAGFYPSRREMFGLAHVESLNAGHLLLTTLVGGVAEYAVDGKSIEPTLWNENAETDACKAKIEKMKSCIQQLVDGAISISVECTEYNAKCFEFNSFTLELAKPVQNAQTVKSAVDFLSQLRRPENRKIYDTFARNTIADAMKFYIENEGGFISQFDKLLDEQLLLKNKF